MGKTTLNIRYAGIQDCRLLADIGTETFYDSFASDNTPENMTLYLSFAFNEETIRKEINDSNSKFLIAEINGEPVGYAHLKFSIPPKEIKGSKPMEIVRFYCRKQWIGKGIGSQLMQKCLDEAAKEKCDEVWLDVWEKNPRAIAFYKKWGFVEVGKQIFILGNDLQQDLVMTKYLV